MCVREEQEQEEEGGEGGVKDMAQEGQTRRFLTSPLIKGSRLRLPAFLLLIHTTLAGMPWFYIKLYRPHYCMP
jgi:hypothetical protein